MTTKNLLLLSLLLLISDLIAQNETENELSQFTSLTTISTAQDEYIDQILEKHNIPAIAIAILRDGKVKELKTRGNLVEGQPANIDAIFNVASLTKPVITMLTLELVENGHWKLDDPLSKYWIDPDIKNHPFTKLLTTRHILTHQSGFPNWRDDTLKFNFKPGEGFNYSGEGFEYLKKALENKFNKSVEKLADSILFNPLMMRNTYFTWNDKVEKVDFAHWHDGNGVNVYKNHKHYSASAADNLLTTIVDYGRFAEYVLSKTIDPKGIYKQMIVRGNNPSNQTVMGLGWEILPNIEEDNYAILHTGGDIGVNTIVLLLPRTREGLVIFTNGDNGNQAYFELIKAYLSLGNQIVGTAQ